MLLKNPHIKPLLWFTLGFLWGCDVPEAEENDTSEDSGNKEAECTSGVFDENGDCKEIEYYECGWVKNEAEQLTGIGSQVGNTIANLTMIDQCSEEIPLWTLSSEYHILFMTAAW